MALSNEWFEFHLTPDGWVSGSEKIDFGGEKPHPVPSDRVHTLRFHEKLTSAYSKMDNWVETEWSHADKNETEKLTKKFGSRPKDWKDHDRV